MSPTEAKRIQRLSPEVIARIAAGEMITRPSAALKELLENAIDAEAARIAVTVGASLDERFAVSDDGVGIPGEELSLALARHTTSKITAEEDLLRVATLGFRGEALAAIAEIARVTITSRTRNSEHGWAIRSEGGQIGEPEAAARAPGTTVLVEDLFYNTPVRRRFLKKGAGEMRQARTTVMAHALATPGIAWLLEQEGRRTIDLPAAANLQERLAQIHGPRIVDGILSVEARDDGLALHGFVGVPELARAGRQHQSFFVNGRWVSSPWLAQAVRQGFGDLIPSHQQPWVVLFLSVAPDRVDVNLHPTKREVRFLEERGIFAAVQRAVRQAVARLLPRLFIGSDDATREGARPTAERGGGGASGLAGAGAGRGQYPQRSFDGLEEGARLYGGVEGSGTLRDAAGLGAFAGAALSGEAEIPGDFVTEAGVLEEGGAAGLVSLWQLHNCYVLAQTRKGMLIIDQHAAHERILYEKILERMTSDASGAQQLLFPVVQELTEEEAALFQEIKGNLVRMGFDIDEFGDRSVLVRGVPPVWRARSEAQLLRDLLAEAAESDLREGETLESLARAFACRAAIRAGTPLSVEEMNRLVDELFATRLPHGDPHGRPTFVFVSLHELSRRFGRSGTE